MIPDRYIDKDIYKKVKAKVDKQYAKPSAYKSAALVKLYKEAGGKIKEEKKYSPLKSWFKREDWKNLSPFAEGLGGKKDFKCGEKHPKQSVPSVCRPAADVNKYSKKQIKKAIQIKKKGGVIQWGKL